MSRRKWISENLDRPEELEVWRNWKPKKTYQVEEPRSGILLDGFTPEELDIVKHVGKGCRSKEYWDGITEEEREARRISNSEAQKRWWAEHSFEEKQERIRGSLEKQDRIFTSVPILDYIPQDKLGWLTGFWEGDGGIDTRTRNTTVRFYQKDIELLRNIRDLVGGGYMSEGGGIYELCFHGVERSLPLIEVFSKLVVSPGSCEKLGKALSLLEQNYEVKENEPTIPWICGFFDAEGSCTLSGQATLSLDMVQKDIKPLEKIQKVVGGKIRKSIRAHVLYLSYGEIKSFIPYYLQYSLYPKKRNEVLAKLLCLAQVSKPWRKFIDGIYG